MRRLLKHNSNADSGLLFLLGQKLEICFSRYFWPRDPSGLVLLYNGPRCLLKNGLGKHLIAFWGGMKMGLIMVKTKKAEGTADWEALKGEAHPV